MASTGDNSGKYVVNRSKFQKRSDNPAIRLAVKLKKRFPRLPIMMVADGLYINRKVIKICKNSGWDYLIRYKEGCAPSIEECYRTTPEKNANGKVEYINEIIFGDEDINVFKVFRNKSKERCRS